MTKYTLTLLDTSGIQDYIFSSNRLQENIGASELVYRATSLWVFDALERAGLTHNIKNPASHNWDFTKATIEEKNSELHAEVVQAAGGNTLILFREFEHAVAFVQTLTLRLLNDAPGLTVLAQHKQDFDFDNGSLPDARRELESKMRAHKASRLASSPTLGLGVTAQCASTGLAAVNALGGSLTVAGKSEPLGLDGEDLSALVSRETEAKRAWRNQANLRLREWLAPAKDKYDFPSNLEMIGRVKGEESYIAVVHADGNRMGEHVQRAVGRETSNRKIIAAMRAFSKSIQQISLAALSAMVGLTVQAVQQGDIPFEVNKDGDPYLPLRPLVFGGDDVTFVCNGDIGVSLAAAYLETFRSEAEKRGLDLHASVGVSIVKLHYPFARAYKLSEELLEEAKSLTRGAEDCSALDWHFAQSGLSGSLDVIRKREYKVKEGQLHLRPLTLANWHQLEAVIEEFNGSYWGAKHNKVLGLRQPLRDGPEAVKKYLRDFDLHDLPGFEGLNVQKTGWLDGTCYYFDAVELLDHHVALKTKEAEA